jgi:hypothetical protein
MRRTAFCVSLFLLTIPAANWSVANLGTTCIPDGPCLILGVPSGAYFAGLALVLRDFIQEKTNYATVIVLTLIGSLLSFVVSPEEVAFASGMAFLVSEALDTTVFSWVRRYGFKIAILASGIIGSFIDSFVFLTIAFDSRDFVLQQTVAKAIFSIAAFGFIHFGILRRPSPDK